MVIITNEADNLHLRGQKMDLELRVDAYDTRTRMQYDRISGLEVELAGTTKEKDLMIQELQQVTTQRGILHEQMTAVGGELSQTREEHRVLTARSNYSTYVHIW